MIFPGIVIRDIDLEITGNSVIEKAISMVTNAAYEDQLRYYRDKDFTKANYDKVIFHALAISNPEHLGNRILQFLYF